MSLMKVLMVLSTIFLGIEESQGTIQIFKKLQTYCNDGVCKGLDFPNETIQVHFMDVLTQFTGSLIFENSNFANFPLGLFTFMNMRTLDINNCSIRRINEESFLNANQLEKLYLHSNQIEEITADTFRSCPNLRYLDLSKNKISKIAEDSFKDLPNLRFLDLANNRIHHLPEKVFSSLNLAFLDLRVNSLTYLNTKIFEGALIQIVYLDGNNIQHLDANVFQNLASYGIIYLSNNPNLQTLELYLKSHILNADSCGLTKVKIFGSVGQLFLSNNSLTSDGLDIENPQDIVTLDLSDNQIESIEFLKQYTNLVNLDLTRNTRIGNINVDFYLPKLWELKLNNISMSEFPSKFFADSYNIRDLSISKNQLQKIDPENYDLLAKLWHIRLGDNPWICDNLIEIFDHWKPKEVHQMKVIGGMKTIDNIACFDSDENDQQIAKESDMILKSITKLQSSLDQIMEMIRIQDIRIENIEKSAQSSKEKK